MLYRAVLLKCVLFFSFIVKDKLWASDFHYIKIDEDFRKNVTLPCFNGNSKEVIKWEKPGREGKDVLPNGDLFLYNLQKKDSGEYKCSIATEDKILSKIHLNVKTPPAKLSNVVIIPSSVHALIRWIITDDGGYPVTNITVIYKKDDMNDTWHFVNPHLISSTATQADIYKLRPNSTYLFQVWASNKLGSGEVTNVTAKTLHDNQEIELARHLLEGAETFDTRTWLAAVAIVMSTLIILTIGTCCALYRDWHIPFRSQDNDPERIELIPNVILNPGYYEDLNWPKQCYESPEEEDDFAMYFARQNGAKAIRV